MSLPASRVAVCSWSLQPKTPAELIDRLAATGVRRVQLALDPLREAPAIWGDAPQLLEAAGMTVVSGMFGTLGEDYTSLETIKRTGGIVPDATWEQNWSNLQTISALGARLGLRLVTFHAGFLPHDPADPGFAKLTERLRRVADAFASNGIQLGLETGQEDAATLDDFLERLDRPSVGVNFDPANMILYAKGEPVAALRRLGRWLRQVHIKDARQTQVAGTWGDEVVVGSGEVDWPAFFRTLDRLRYAGDLCIEREAGARRVEDIRAAVDYLAGIRV